MAASGTVSKAGRARRAVALAVAVVVAGAPAAWSAQTPIAVKAQPNPIHEIAEAVSANWFAWSQTSAAHPRSYDVYLQAMVGGKPSGPITRVNPAGTQGFAGGISGTTLAYQQVTGNGSDIRFYDLVTRQISNPPPGVNSADREYRPTISGTWLLFGRDRGGQRRELLYNLASRSIRVLQTEPLSYPNGLTFLQPGQVNGDYATFAAGVTLYGSVSLYTISTRTLTTVVATQFGSNSCGVRSPAVSSSGTLYFIQLEDVAPGWASTQATLFDQTLGSRCVLYTACDLHDFEFGFQVPRVQVYSSGSTDHVFYTRLHLTNGSQDIYSVTGP